jgi:hypothetical protein
MRAARISLLITVIGAVAIVAAPAQARPSNDRLHNATTISSVPAVITQDTTDAAADGPRFCTRGNNSSVFFRYTPSEDVMLQADTFGSGRDYDTVLKVFTGERGAFELVACNDDFLDLQSAVSFAAEAATTYFFMVATCCSGSQDNEGGDLEFALSVAPTAAPDVSGTIDGARLTSGRKLIVNGTLTCSQRTGVFLAGSARQVRDDLFLARGSSVDIVGCDPGAPNEWRVRIDSRTSVIFAPGSASVRGEFFAVDTAGFTDGTIGRTQVTIA